MQELLTDSANKASLSQLSRAFDLSRSGLHCARERIRQPTAATGHHSLRLQAAFAASGRTYGSRRLSAALKREGVSIGRYRTRALMRANGLRASWGRKFVHTTDSRHPLPIADNVLDRQFAPPQPNRVWAGDITYIRTGSGWLYLAVVIDLFSRKIVGWAMASHMRASLVCEAAALAIGSRQPTAGLLMHSDRGSQYASEVHTDLLATHGLVPSMSRKGNCWDNAVTERFFLNLKMERVWQRQYANHLEASQDITDYIVHFYNAQRLHSTLGYVPPNEFERNHALNHPSNPIPNP